VHKKVQFLFKISTRFLHGSDTRGAPTPHTFPFAVFRGPSHSVAHFHPC